MSRQPTLAKFSFGLSIEHRDSQRDIKLSDFVVKTKKKFTCSTGSKAFINQQGLSVHVINRLSTSKKSSYKKRVY